MSRNINEPTEWRDKMAKVLRCSDMGASCSWVGRAETEEELFKMAAKHAAESHGMKEIPKELLEKAKAVIRDE
jgi:predicted small metal-binding protein